MEAQLTCPKNKSKLTIHYNSHPADARSSAEAALESTDNHVAKGAPADRRWTQFIASYDEPVSVRADMWYSLVTCLGRLEYWSGPVLRQRWQAQQPQYLIDLIGTRSFGFQLYLGWQEQLMALSVSCFMGKRSTIGSWSPMRWTVSFPRIVSRHADIFQYISSRNLAAVRTLFATRKATPWDASPDGNGLLHVCSETQVALRVLGKPLTMLS